jgi:riboflavin kinase
MESRALKGYQIPLLLELLRLGAKESHVPISTSELGRRVGDSQQTASHHLVELERKNLIERRKLRNRSAIKLTQKGVDAIETYYSEIKSALESERHELVFHGSLFRGLGEGAYYVSLGGYREQFKKLLGFEPYAGTLNLKLSSPLDIDKKRQIHFWKGLQVQGFANGRRTYGPAKCFRAVVAGKYKAAVLVIERTHYDDTVLELISPVHIRKALGLRDGDELSVRVMLAS